MRYFIGGIIGLACAASAIASQPPAERGVQDERSILHRVSMAHDHDSKLTRALGVRLDSTTNGIIISEVFVSMPAYSAGLCKGDKLLAINHRPVSSLAAAVQQTQNISADHVMLDVQRKDMRICRRVEVQDGHAQYIGSFKHNRTLALSISQFAPETSEQLMEIFKLYSPSDIDTMILDLRDNRGGSRYEAQSIARLLGGSQDRNRPALKMIILQSDIETSAAQSLADMLVQQRDADIWGRSASASIMNDVSGQPIARDLPASHIPEVAPAATEAPVQWNMAAFRESYPTPTTAAAAHPMIAHSQDIAPIVWGINGNAYAALTLVKSVL